MQDVGYRQLSPEVRTLPNGLTVVAEHLPYVHSASVGVWVGAGSANESPEVAGISHLLEHMFFKGTESRSSLELMDAIESRGGHMNAFTTRESTCLYAKVLDHHVDTAVDVLGDIIKRSTFVDLEKERNVILEEIAAGKDTPDEHVHDMLSGYAWPEHPLGRPIAGYEETVAQTGLEQLRTYMESRYRPDNMHVSLVGNFDVEEFFALVEAEFGELAPGDVENGAVAPTFHAGLLTESRDIAQSHLVSVFPGTPITAKDRYCYDVLSSALGGGSTSRLFESVREREGLAYSIYSFNAMFQTGGMLGFYAAVAPENLAQTIDLCTQEMRKLKEVALPEAELLSNREQLKGGLLLALEGTFNRMARMVRSLMLFERIVPVRDILDAVDAVTAADVQALAERVFAEEQCAAAVLGPANGVASVPTP